MHHLRPKWEDDILSDQLSDKSHRWVIRRLSNIVQHSVAVVELTDEVRKLGGWNPLTNIVVNQINQDIFNWCVFDVLPPLWQLLSLLLLSFLSLFLALLLAFLLLDVSEGLHVFKFCFDDLVHFILELLFNKGHYF